SDLESSGTDTSGPSTCGPTDMSGSKSSGGSGVAGGALTTSRLVLPGASSGSPAGVGVERDEITNVSHAACGGYRYPDRGRLSGGRACAAKSLSGGGGSQSTPRTGRFSVRESARLDRELRPVMAPLR